MVKHPIITIALNLFFVGAVVFVAAFCLNLIVYSYIDYAFPHHALAAAK